MTAHPVFSFLRLGALPGQPSADRRSDLAGQTCDAYRSLPFGPIWERSQIDHIKIAAGTTGPDPRRTTHCIEESTP